MKEIHGLLEDVLRKASQFNISKPAKFEMNR